MRIESLSLQQKMTHLRILLFVVLPAILWGQNKPQDCYIYHLDAGTVAQQRGDYSKALSHYKQGLDCPETQQIARRIADLKANIAQCESVLYPSKKKQKRQNTFAPIQGFEERKRFMLSAAFLRDTSKDCFYITFQEAERAYRGGFWDDAAALYRAAKNCSDATQERRSQVSNRITDCRNSAEDELRMKELEALRRTRQAVASNMADEAQKLMDDGDKTTAFRLANFANKYIAPDENPDCVQTLFDIGDANAKKFDGHVPFCYHVEQFESIVDLGFLDQKGKQELVAFDPKSNQLHIWTGSEFVPRQSVTISKEGGINQLHPGQRYKSFLIGGDKETLLWKNPKDVVKLNIKLPKVYCFNEDQTDLYFYSDKENAMMVLALKTISKSRKDNTLEQSRYVPRPILPDLKKQIKGVAFFEGRLWLAYSNHIEIWEQNINRRTWAMAKSMPFGIDLGEDSEITLRPAQNLLVATTDSTYFLRISDGTISVQGFDFLASALSDDASMIAYTKFGLQHINHLDGTDLIIQDTRNQQIRYRSAIPSSELLGIINGCVFSKNAEWLAMSTTGGNVMVWHLDSPQLILESDTTYNIAVNSARLSPDGKRYFAFMDSTIQVLPTEEYPEKIPSIVMTGNSMHKYKAISNNWVVWQKDVDSLALQNLSTGRKISFATGSKSGYEKVHIDPSENFIAYTIGKDSVVVRSLKNGMVIASKNFGVGIFDLELNKGAQKLVLKLEKLAGIYGSGSQTVIKVWNLQEYNVAPKSLGLRNYDADQWSISPNGSLIALSNIEGSEIHLFNLDSLSDELPPLRVMKDMTISSFNFSPDNNVLAVAFQLGYMTLFDVKTGQSRLVLSADKLMATNINQICFMDNGKTIRTIRSDWRYYSRDLDPDNIIKKTPGSALLLSAFSPDQISNFVLDEALDYGNNFDRLAQSGDKPLILSFFQYYSKQAATSNNINLVSQYCDRAYELYLRLKSPPELLKPLGQMYRDYAWKCLLRNDLKRGTSVTEFLKNSLSDLIGTRFLQAHIALLRNDYGGATKQYTDILMNHTEANAYLIGIRIDSLFEQARELYEYDLLNAEDLGCLCSIFGELKPNNPFCRQVKKSTLATTYLGPKEQQRWAIFKHYAIASDYTTPARERQKLLRQNVHELENLVKQQPTYWMLDYENNLFELATLYFSKGILESNHKYRALQYDTALMLLESKVFSPQKLLVRPENMSLVHMAYGDLFASKNQYKEAIAQYDLGLKDLDVLADRLLNDSSQNANSGQSMRFLLLEKKGTALLFEKKIADAQLTFEKAEEIDDLHDLYFGYVDLLENRETQALANFRQIYATDQLAAVMFTIEQLTIQYPESKNRFLSFTNKLRDSVIRDLESILLGAWELPVKLSEQKRQYYQANGQYGAALKIATNSYIILDSLVRRNKDQWEANFDLFSSWSYSVLNYSYLTLFTYWNNPKQLEIVLAHSLDAQKLSDDLGVVLPVSEQLLTNIGHAQLLLGRRDLAIKAYKTYIGSSADSESDKFTTLYNDFRDLHDYGIKWPDLKPIIEEIIPKGYNLTGAEWKLIGL